MPGPHWRDTEASKAEVRSVIKDFLWDEQKALPDTYLLEEVEERSGRLFEFFYQQGGWMAA